MKTTQELYHKHSDELCVQHLERAHILGQHHDITHVRNHYWMYKKVALKKRDLREIAGQIVRMIMSAGSLVFGAPLGNSGRARISPIMPIPKDLQGFLCE